METIVAKMKDYLKMETEIEAKEFATYYQELLSFLQKDFQTIDKDGLIKMAAVTQILAMNAQERGNRRDADSKKFKKMAEKSKFWFDAIEYKLNKEHGMSKTEVEEATDTVFAE